MNHFFISGMGRSGTTLLDKLLSNHNDIDVLSQPMPLVFIEVKKRFLQETGHDKYYVLNDDFINRDYSQEKFDTYLSNFDIARHDIEQIFSKMETYSGQCTKPGKGRSVGSKTLGGYAEIIDRCLELFDTDNGSRYLGIKEPMCEEFIPYLIKNSYKAIVIVRDPRDVLASANYPRKVQYLGSKKPTLFILRTWRKSAEYVHSLKDNENFHFLRYEDLVSHPYRELDKITDFLGLEKFLPDVFSQGILDRNGEPWLANTSFEEGENLISNQSVGIYKATLSDDEIRYTESICFQEMEKLQYQVDTSNDKHEIIKNFKDTDIEDSIDIKADFSSQDVNVRKELHRLTNSEKIHLSIK